MGSQTLIYKEKFLKALDESQKHLNRMEKAFENLQKSYPFPIDEHSFHTLLANDTHLAFADQIIYRFSKAQDSIGAKLFKAYLAYQGENTDKPFLDILSSLEKIKILNIDDWFELREIRNEIAHDYDDNEEKGREIINSIYKHKRDIASVLASLNKSPH